MRYTMIGLLTLFVVFFSLNLISVILTFIGLTKAFSVFFAAVICLILLLLFFSGFKMEINGTEYNLQIFPGKRLLKFGLFLVVVVAIVFTTFGERDLKRYFSDFKVTKAQKAKEKTIRTISSGKVFSEVDWKWIWIGDTRGSSFGLEDTTDKGRVIFKFRLEGKKTGVYDGKIVWVPLDLIGDRPFKRSSPKSQSSAVEIKNKSQLEIGKEWWSSLFKNESFGVVKITPEEVFKGDLYGDSSDKLKLFIAGFENGDIIEFQEDFWAKTNGGKRQNTVLFADNKNIKSFRGDKIPRGTRFHVRGKKGVNLLFFSEGRTQVDFSNLVLRKIN